MMQPHYSDASNPAKRRNDRDSAEDCAGLDNIRDEIKKLWAEKRRSTTTSRQWGRSFMSLKRRWLRSPC